MSTLFTINIQNNSSSFQNFYVFQQPAIYVGGQQVYSNSLWSQGVLPSSTGGSSATFLMLQQFYAGVQQQITPPAVGGVSGYSSAIQAIGLTPAAGGSPTNNTTSMIISPALGLTPPVNTTGPQAGSYRIITPTFNPTVTPYNAGAASQSPSGIVTLSNFVVAQPNQNIDCQPVLQFYVQTGTYTPGTVINFSTSSVNAALCNATTGFVTFNVSYNVDGTWSVTSSAATKVMGQPRIQAQAHPSTLSLSADAANNAEIKNEAGTAVICTGYAANFNTPVTVQALSNPGVIQLHSEYQVGPTGGPYTGRMCTSIVGNTATFA
ncbi:hypothetical protein [Nitrosospira sp. NpAV]|uniref:hypothetical protein n=1 Tax=Nitrosospira sp. NpAV TaxID=58133 RepID=UPI00059EE94D|nr:hypothetical protein [Nitrosospira sp. NpAV]KIO48458.1 hypothetical protein SQ11_12060 [Nitrosospira sp. NpAV]